MLAKVVSTIQKELNNFLAARYLNSDIVIPANVVDQNGNIASEEPQILLSLINIEQETTANKSSPSFVRTSTGNTNSVSPPISINIYLLFSAHFKNENYLKGLELLSSIISFFQAKPIFNHQNTPSLDAEIEKLLFKIASLDLSELSHLWGTIGAKYMPSIIYKVRMLTYQSDQIITEIPEVKGISTDTAPDNK